MKQLSDEQIVDQMPADLFNPNYIQLQIQFGLNVIAEFCKINNITGEAQPAREWVGLTEVETEALWKKHSFERWDHGGTEVMREGNFEDAARDLDSKLREKNARKPAADDKAGGEPVYQAQYIGDRWDDIDAQEFERLQGSPTIKSRKLYTRPQPQAERNFCERCGKRLGAGIHTCTPPQTDDKAGGKAGGKVVAYLKPGEGDYEKAFSWNYNERNGYTQPLYTRPPAASHPSRLCAGAGGADA